MGRPISPLGLDASPPVWVRVVPIDPHLSPLERLVELTPYMVQTIIEDARGSGRCRKLEVVLGPGRRAAASKDVDRLLTAARAAGLAVEVHRSAASPAVPLPSPPAKGRRAPP